MKFTESDIRHMVKESVERVLSETRGILNGRLRDLAVYIVERLKTEDEFIIPAETLKDFTHYYAPTKPLKVTKIDDGTTNSLASYNFSPTSEYDELVVNDFEGYRNVKSFVGTIMHELTHMVNRNMPNSRVQGGTSINATLPIEQVANAAIYLFQDTEMQARINEIPDFLETHPWVTKLEDCNEILCLGQMRQIIDLIKNWGMFNSLMAGGDFLSMLFGAKKYIKANKNNTQMNGTFPMHNNNEIEKIRKNLIKSFSKRYINFYKKAAKVFYDYKHADN